MQIQRSVTNPVFRGPKSAPRTATLLRLAGGLLLCAALFVPGLAHAGMIEIRGVVFSTALSPIPPQSPFRAPAPGVRPGDLVLGSIEFDDSFVAPSGTSALEIGSGLLSVSFRVGPLRFDETTGQDVGGIDAFPATLTAVDGEVARFDFDGRFRLDADGKLIRATGELGDIFFVTRGDRIRGSFGLLQEDGESRFATVASATFRLVPEPQLAQLLLIALGALWVCRRSIRSS